MTGGFSSCSLMPVRSSNFETALGSPRTTLPIRAMARTQPTLLSSITEAASPEHPPKGSRPFSVNVHRNLRGRDRAATTATSPAAGRPTVWPTRRSEPASPRSASRRCLEHRDTAAARHWPNSTELPQRTSLPELRQPHWLAQLPPTVLGRNGRRPLFPHSWAGDVEPEQDGAGGKSQLLMSAETRRIRLQPEGQTQQHQTAESPKREQSLLPAGDGRTLRSRWWDHDGGGDVSGHWELDKRDGSRMPRSLGESQRNPRFFDRPPTRSLRTGKVSRSGCRRSRFRM